MRIGFMSTAVMAANLGMAAMAAHQVGMNIMSVSFSFGDGMQAAAVALIGRSLGEKSPEEAVRYGNICQRIGNVISLVLSVVYLLAGRGLYRLFFDDPEIVDMGVRIRALIVFIVISTVAADCAGNLYGLPAGGGGRDVYHGGFHLQRYLCADCGLLCDGLCVRLRDSWGLDGGAGRSVKPVYPYHLAV